MISITPYIQKIEAMRRRALMVAESGKTLDDEEKARDIANVLQRTVETLLRLERRYVKDDFDFRGEFDQEFEIDLAQSVSGDVYLEEEEEEEYTGWRYGVKAW